MYKYIHTHIFTQIHTHKYIYISMHKSVNVYKHIFVWICVYIYIYIYTRTDVYPHTEYRPYSSIWMHWYKFGLMENFSCFFLFVWWHINLLGLFNAKFTFREEQQWYYLTLCWEDKGVHTFPKSFCPKENVMAWLEFEPAYYDSAVQRVNLYPTRPSSFFMMYW